MDYDVIVVGGSYAGMAAALQLLRARRSVLIVDAGQRRNRFVSEAHGFLGFDGADPAQIAATARAQLHQYPGLTWIDGAVTRADGTRDRFTITLADGGQHHARRLLFANGVADELPQIDGLAERWGTSVFHCPYCHGYELDQGRIGVIASGPNSLHQAMLLPEWGDVTLLVNEALALDSAQQAELSARGVSIAQGPIARLSGHADVVLSSGQVLEFAGLFAAPTCAPASDIAQQMGAKIVENAMGRMIATDDMKQTNLAGVFACGDTARMPHSLSLAVGDGAWAGATIHRSLVFPDL